MNMKKILLFAAILFVGAAQLRAQDCAAITLPYFHGDEEAQQAYPKEKLEWRCAYARNSFYTTDSIPQGVRVHQISEVEDVATGLHLNQNVKIDLNTFSYYAYNFADFQYADFYNEIYFETPGCSFGYLVVRTINDVYLRSQFPEKYADESKK